MPRLPIRRLIRLSLCCGVVYAAGCADFGAGGTGEYVVPEQRFRQIQTTEPDQLPTAGPAATQPFVLATTMPSTQLAEMPISLEQVRRWAIQNNLELQVDLLDPTIAKADLSAEQARFEAVFTTDARYGTTDTPFLATDENGNRFVRASGADFFSVAPGLNFPLTSGGLISLAVPFNRVENTVGRISTETGLPQSSLEYTSDFTLTFSQPLLRGGGVDANAASIRIAFYAYQQVEARTKLRVLTVLSDADRAYWRLYAAAGNLKVRKQEYDLAQLQLDRARRQAAAGIVAEVEVTRAESGVAERVTGVVQAERALRIELRELKRIINQPGLEMNSRVLLVPTSDPRFLESRLDADALADMAIRDRMEILDAELAIYAEAARVKLARNDMLPLLDLQYRYNVNGIGESAGDSFELLADNDFADHSVGLSLDIPLGNQVARNRLRSALARRQQAIATRTLREQTVRQEVLAAVTDLETSWQQILAARQAVLTAARVVQLETRQFEQGLRTSTDVLDAQTALANAQAQEVVAVANYQIAQVDIALATGTLLGASRVDWTPIVPADR